MARSRTIQNSFNSGEWSPLLEGRSDLDKYKNAAKTISNFICFKHGGASRRPGTKFVAEVKDSTKRTRLIRFEFSTEQAYIIEIGDLYMRFYKDNGRIEDPPGTPVEIVTPYLEADIFSIHFVQSADVIYLAHRNYSPRKLSRTSHTVWTLTELGTGGDSGYLAGPFLPIRTDIVFTPSAISGAGITITASAPFFDDPGHVGALLRLGHSGTFGYAKITGVSSDQIATATVYDDFGDTITSDAFQEGAWSTFRGFPATVTLFQQRLFFSGSDYKPDTIWGSKTTEYENFDAGTADDDEAITFTLASNRVNSIRWLAPSRRLLAGTVGQEWQIGGGTTEEPITPGNPDAHAETTHGSSTVAPVQVHNAVLFVQRAGRKLREFSFNFDSDAYTAPDMSILAEHITEGGIVQMDYQQEQDSIIWAIRGDGILLGLTYERPQDVIAWHRHITSGDFESVACIPHPTADEDQTWVIVKRNVEGADVRYVEYLDTQDGFYGNLQVDSGLSYSGVAADTISNLDHLEGRTVDVLGNGAVYPQKVVTGGQITGLSPEVTEAEVGLPFHSDLLTMRPEEGLQSGTAQDALKRFSKVTARLHESLGGMINSEQLEFRSAADPMDEPPALFSGDRRVSNLGWDRDGRIRIQQQQPLPLTVLAIIGVLNVND